MCSSIVKCNKIQYIYSDRTDSHLQNKPKQGGIKKAAQFGKNDTGTECNDDPHSIGEKVFFYRSFKNPSVYNKTFSPPYSKEHT